MSIIDFVTSKPNPKMPLTALPVYSSDSAMIPVEVQNKNIIDHVNKETWLITLGCISDSIFMKEIFLPK